MHSTCTRPDLTNIALIACCKKKLDRPAPARELYQSPLFQKSLAYAETLKECGLIDEVHILSAKHWIVDPDEELEPYDRSLHDLPAGDRGLWALEIFYALSSHFDIEDTNFVFLAGRLYREKLVTALDHCTVPLEGLGIGEQLAVLTHELEARRCRQCGCTDHDCGLCIDRTGEPCSWIEGDLCSACAKEPAAAAA